MKFKKVIKDIALDPKVKGSKSNATTPIKDHNDEFIEVGNKAKGQKSIAEKVQSGHKRLATATGGSATGKKVDNYLSKLDKDGSIDDIEKQIKKKGLTGERAAAYKWSILHKRMRGHFND